MFHSIDNAPLFVAPLHESKARTEKMRMRLRSKGVRPVLGYVKKFHIILGRWSNRKIVPQRLGRGAGNKM